MNQENQRQKTGQQILGHYYMYSDQRKCAQAKIGNTLIKHKIAPWYSFDRHQWIIGNINLLCVFFGQKPPPQLDTFLS